uniref:ALK and LTK ligand 1 isoform X1 n=1 Tax=Geotrypetes seraphini TaxID=260995 RepID=A0A6P8QF72_GEOSA|nr:ALK and LTK ligand 1 isoform X1 [Geotrypetes seraphini]XP_033785428.1 ALK and LTK ligand 1 isoform X1 [Geotrypetes seraphini]
MRGSRKSHARVIICFLLLATSAWGSHWDSDVEQNGRRTLLDRLLQAVGEKSRNSKEGSNVIPRRSARSGYFAAQEFHRPASGERSASVRRLEGRARREISHDDSLKDKFIKHFTGPVEFTSECSQYFFHLYYNTRDCAIPAYYKRCARLLTRLAMSPLCTQP